MSPSPSPSAASPVTVAVVHENASSPKRFGDVTDLRARRRDRVRVAFATVALGAVVGTANAVPISEDIHFSLSGFVDVTGSVAPPIPLVTGFITVNYDPALTYDNDTTDLVVHSLTGAVIDSTLGFTYQGGFLEFGGIANDADQVFSFTNDLVVAFDVTDPSAPKFVPCSTPGYTCGKYTGSALVEAAGYTQAGSNTGWFYGAPQSTVSPVPIPSAVPEPQTYALMALGLSALGMVRRRRNATLGASARTMARHRR